MDDENSPPSPTENEIVFYCCRVKANASVPPLLLFLALISFALISMPSVALKKELTLRNLTAVDAVDHGQLVAFAWTQIFLLAVVGLALLAFAVGECRKSRPSCFNPEEGTDYGKLLPQSETKEQENAHDQLQTPSTSPADPLHIVATCCSTRVCRWIKVAMILASPFIGIAMLMAVIGTAIWGFYIFIAALCCYEQMQRPALLSVWFIDVAAALLLLAVVALVVSVPVVIVYFCVKAYRDTASDLLQSQQQQPGQV